MTNATASSQPGPSSDERRRARRAKAPSGLGLRIPGLLDPAVVEDISSSGVCCTTVQAVPLLSQVQLVLLLPIGGTTREVVCAGAVVRCARRGGASGDSRRRAHGSLDARVGSSQHGASHGGSEGAVHETAIFFTEIDDADRTALDEYVSSLHRAGMVA
ncbi:MAG: hypothetical protein K8T90_08175 [Planctomycetes bacterium]|nr:hypothetical protein [Planctomycetota bacterium]